jgi:hypothetical protein
MADDVIAASRHDHLVVYDPGAIPPDTPFDPDMMTGEPAPLPAETLTTLAAEGRALILHFPGEDCEATIRVVLGPPSDLARERGQLLLQGARLQLPAGQAIADGAEFIHAKGQKRDQGQERATVVPPGDYAVSVTTLIAWKEAHRNAWLTRATTPAARTVDRIATVIAIAGAVLVPLNLLLAPIAIAIGWRRGGFRAAGIVTGTIVAVDAVVIGAAAVLQGLQRRHPALGGAVAARTEFDRENPDVIVSLEPWTGGEARPTWATLVV